MKSKETISLLWTQNSKSSFKRKSHANQGEKKSSFYLPVSTKTILEIFSPMGDAPLEKTQKVLKKNSHFYLISDKAGLVEGSTQT